MNTVILSGNLTRDIETRYLQSGTAIGAFGIASNRKWKDQSSGEMKEEVTFVDVTAFGKQAETVAQYFKKGSKILITGRLKLDQWDDKQSGQKRSKLGVVVESFSFVDSKVGEGSARQGNDAPRPADNPEPDSDEPPF